MIKKIISVAMSLALLLVMVGCGSPSSKTTETSKSGSTSGKENLKIGVTLPMSGPAAFSGEQALKGIKLAADMINQKGGVLGQQIELVVYDDKANPEEGVNTIQKLITRDQVKFTVGGLQSSVSLAQANALKEKGILQFVLVSKAPKITEEGHGLLFRFNTSSKMDSTYFPQFISKEVHPNTVAIIAEQTDYGQAEVAELKKAWANGGPKIVATEWIQLTDTDFTSQLTKVKSSNADAMFFITSPPATIAALATQSKEIGFKAPKLIAVGNLNKDLIKLSTEGMEGAISADIYMNGSDSSVNQEFVKAFKEKNNYVPEKYEELSYEAITILVQAIEKAGKADPQAVSKILKENQWTSPRGEVTFDAKGQAISKNYFSQMVKNGKIESYKP